jgi:hypothetical protein
MALQRRAPGPRMRIIEPSQRRFTRTEQVAFQEQMAGRYRTLYYPRYGWEYPAYTKFEGMGQQAYPHNYGLMYVSLRYLKYRRYIYIRK